MGEERKDWRALDDAAAAALWALRNEPMEHIGLLYEQGGIRATPTATTNRRSTTGGAFQIPKGSLRALFHNHPARKKRGGMASESRDRTRTDFSEDDIAQARRLGVPSYIAAGPKLRRYDPATGRTEDVLAEIPIDVIVRDLMVRLLNRDPNDPRGLYRETKSANLPGLLAER